MMVYIFYDKFLKRVRSTLIDPKNSRNSKPCPLCGEPWVAMIYHLKKHHKVYGKTLKILADSEPRYIS